MDKKVFYFDIDGTLATPLGITESNKEVLKLLKAKGHHVMIASGRPAWYVKNMFGPLIDGLISSNGRHIEYHDEIILDSFLELATLQKIVRICNEVKCGYLFVGKETMYLGNKQYVTIPLHYQQAPIEDFSLTNIQVYMFDIFYQSPEHFQQIEAAFKDFIILNDHHVGSADASTLTINKGSAVSYCTNYLGLTKEDSYAFGDGQNDIDMFKAVGHAIAMGNANDFVKAHSDDVTDAVEQEGIKKALLKYHIL